MAKQIKYLDLEGLKALYGVVDGKITVEKDRALAAEKGLSDAIAAMDLDDTAVSGKFITSVHQTDGKVTVDRGGVSSEMVTAVAVGGGTDTVAIEGTTVDAQIKSLGKALKTVEGNAVKYRIEQVSQEEVDIIDPSIREAYRLISYVGDYVEGTKYPSVGQYIKIYKDANLKNAELGTGEDAQKLILTYILSDGREEVVKVDFAAMAFNAEFKNGLQVAKNGEISVKIDTTGENFLTVGADGVKLAGVQNAIDAAKAAATTKVAKGGEGTHVTVTAGAPAPDGSVTYTIGETDIASDDALTAEVSRAKAAEDMIEASVGLAADGSFTAPAGKNYINGATTVMGAVEKLDAQVKVNAVAIDGAINEDAQSITLGTKGLRFVAFTPEEIRQAADDAAVQ